MSAVLRYGLIAALVVCALTLGPALLFGPRTDWMQWGELVGYTTMVLAMTATGFAMRAARRERGALRYRDALWVGVGVSLVASVIFGVATWLFYTWAGDALPQAAYEFYLARAQGDAAKVAEIEAMRGFFFNRPLQGAVMFATLFLIGLAESVVAAWLVTRRGARTVAQRA
jgi:hypothetical protein